MAFRNPNSGAEQAEFHRALAMTLRSDHIGDWGSDHRQEAKSFQGWNYMAISAIGRLAARATPYVYDASEPANVEKRKALIGQYRSFWKSYADEGAAKVAPADHWMVELVNNPNRSQTRQLFQWEFMQQMHLHGCCLIYNRPTKDGQRIAQRYIVPMSLTQPIYKGWDKNTPNGGVRIMPASAGLGFFINPIIKSMSGAIIPAELLSVIRYPDPLLRGDGKSPTDAAGWWIDTALMTDMARWKQLKRGPRPHGVVTVKGEDGSPVPEDYLDMIEQRMNRKLGDEQYDQRVIAVGDGTQVPTEASPVDMDYVNSFDQLGQVVLATHGVGKVAVGLNDSQTYGSVAANLLQTIAAVESDLDLLAGDWTMLARDCGENLEIQYEVPGYDDPTLTEQQLQTDLQAGNRTGREWRAIRGLPPWGDWRDDARVTGQGFVLDSKAPPQPGAEAAGPGPGGGAEGGGGGPPGMPGMMPPSPMQGETQPGGLPGPGNPMAKSFAKAWRAGHYVWHTGQGERPPIVAVDLDGTLAHEEGEFHPDLIGDPIDECVADVRRLKEAGCLICVFTCRDNDAIVMNWLDTHGVPYDALNAQPEGFEGSGKSFADVYWDNRAVAHDAGLRSVVKKLPEGSIKRTLLSNVDRPADEPSYIAFELPESVVEEVECEQQMIDEDDLCGEGCVKPHITLVYGIVGVPLGEIVEAVRRLDEFEVTFGNLSAFPPKEGKCAIKFDVESPEIHRANALIKRCLPTVETFPDYKPHLTVGFVAEGSTCLAELPAPGMLTGKAARITSAYVVAEGKRVSVPLRVSGGVEMGLSQVVLPGPDAVIQTQPLGLPAPNAIAAACLPEKPGGMVLGMAKALTFEDPVEVERQTLAAVLAKMNERMDSLAKAVTERPVSPVRRRKKRTPTQRARLLMKRLPMPRGFEDYKQQVRTVAETVALQIGVSPVECLAKCIDPTVFASWKSHANWCEEQRQAGYARSAAMLEATGAMAKAVTESVRLSAGVAGAMQSIEGSFAKAVTSMGEQQAELAGALTNVAGTVALATADAATRHAQVTEQLAASLDRPLPAANITVNVPEMGAPVVNVSVPAQAAPIVNVEAPVNVSVEPAKVELELEVEAKIPPRKTTTEIERDHSDLITKITQTEKDA